MPPKTPPKASQTPKVTNDVGNRDGPKRKFKQGSKSSVVGAKKLPKTETTAIQVQIQIPEDNLLLSNTEVSSVASIQVQSIPKANLFFMSNDFSDVILEAEGQKFPAHRVVLASLSPVFLAMFHTQMKEASEGLVVIDDIEAKIVQEMLYYMYSGGVLSEKCAFEALSIDLFKMADKYGIECLKIKCRKQIQKKLSVSNALEVYILADAHDEKILMQSALEVMKKNKLAFLKDPETLRDLANRYPQLAFQLAITFHTQSF